MTEILLTEEDAAQRLGVSPDEIEDHDPERGDQGGSGVGDRMKIPETDLQDSWTRNGGGSRVT